MKKLIPLLMMMMVAACAESEAPLSRAAAADASAAAPAGQERAAAAKPMIVRTAEMRITVDDTAKSVAAITKATQDGGGYVSGSHVWHEGELLRAKLTLRVPSEKLTETLAAIRGMAKRVENETVTSEDVSQQYVDLEAQLRNLEATEAELRELLTVARVNSKKATEVLEVHQQLTNIRGQIEQIRGRLRYFSQMTSYSAVNLDVAPLVPVVATGWQPLRDMREATRALVVLLQKLGTAAIWFVIYLVPVFGMLALVIAVLVRVARRTRTA